MAFVFPKCTINLSISGVMIQFFYIYHYVCILMCKILYIKKQTPCKSNIYKELWYTRRESNPNLGNRNPTFYPLNYGCSYLLYLHYHMLGKSVYNICTYYNANNFIS